VFRPVNLHQGMTVRMTRTEYRSGELRFDLITAAASLPPGADHSPHP